MIGELNINSLANKFEYLKTFVGKYVDILILIKTKLDSSFPSTQFLIDGYSTPYRLDRNIHGVGGGGGGCLFTLGMIYYVLNYSNILRIGT